MSSTFTALTNLGFAEEEFPKGTKICQIYSDEQERQSTLFAFIESGLRGNERVACLSDKTNDETVCRWLDSQGLDSQSFKNRSQLSFASTQESYFSGNKFNPEPMLQVLQSFYNDSLQEGQNGARVIGEMQPRISEVKGVKKLMEYEARVCLMQQKFPVTAVCQYDARAFDGATIMNVLKIHPLLMMRGAIIRNPFFIPARDVLATLGCS